MFVLLKQQLFIPLYSVIFGRFVSLQKSVEDRKNKKLKQDNKRHIAILGSTGSIGTQALDVIKQHQDKFVVEVLTAQDNAD